MDVVEQHTPSQIKSENSKSVKVLEELLSKLTVSKSQDEINASSNDLASFINGDIEEQMAPTKRVDILTLHQLDLVALKNPTDFATIAPSHC